MRVAACWRRRWAPSASLGCPRAPRERRLRPGGAAALGRALVVADVLLFGTPAAEPHQAEGFYREAAPADGRPLRLVEGRGRGLARPGPRRGARSRSWTSRPTAACKGQSAEVLLNGTSRRAPHPQRRAPPLRLRAAGRGAARGRQPAALRVRGHGLARRRSAATPTAGSSRPRSTASPSGTPATRASRTCSPATRRGRSRSPGRSGVPALVQVGPSVVRYALRVPAAGELRFTPELHPGARAAGASASLRVTEEARAGEEQELWSAVLGPRAARRPRCGCRCRARPATSCASACTWAGGRDRGPLRLGGVERAAGPRPRGHGGERPRPRRRLRKTQRRGRRPARGPRRDERRPRRPRRRRGPTTSAPTATRGRPRRRSTASPARACVFERAFTPAVYTLGAMSSVWTSQYPDRHHAEVSFAARLPADRLTLAELLGAQGIHTAGFVANAMAGAFNGFDRGFAEFHEVWREQATSDAGGLRADGARPGSRRRRGRRFFAYVHFREPHFPYDPPAALRHALRPRRPDPEGGTARARRRLDHGREPGPAAADRGGEGAPRAPLRRQPRLRGRRRSASSATALEKAGLLETHGRDRDRRPRRGALRARLDRPQRAALRGEHPRAADRALPGGQGAGGGNAARRRWSTCSTSRPPSPTCSASWATAARTSSSRAAACCPCCAGAPGKPAVLSRTVWDRPRYALRDARYKFLYDTRTGEEELFDLARDPGETTNLVGVGSAARRLVAPGRSTTGSPPRPRAATSGTAAPARFTREQCENLRALGYLGAPT